MTKIDETRLQTMTVHERHNLWKNARKLDTQEAKEMLLLIENCGLPYSEPGSLKLDDPICLKMHEIIFSTEGKKAGVEASEKGIPALAGIDPLLFAALGIDYGGHNDATINAGYLVAQMMRTQGYKNSGRKGKLPRTCIAKTAEIYIPIK